MKIGATERTFFDVWHPDAVKLFNKSSSLSRVCHELYDPDHRLPDAEKDISVFSCFQPQLAAFKKENLSEVVKRMNGKPFYIEEKLDGERIQLHKKGDEFKYWSRKAKDYTYLYGRSYGDATNQEGGGLTKYLRHAFDDKVSSIVLDGEMITWNDAFDAPIPFGSLKTAAKAEMNNANTSVDGHPFFCIFDVLHLNGTSLTNFTLRKRREVLKRVIRPVKRRIEVVEIQEATKESEVETRLRQCVAESSEGLVVKDPNTAYHPNERNDNWIKVKPEYMAEFGENLDLLIIGGNFGEGKRGGFKSSFICGLRKDSGDSPTPFFESFCKVGGGFSGPDYAAIHHATDGHWQKFHSIRVPEQFKYAMSSNGNAIEAPDEWIAPEHSVVIQVKAASATTSDQFATRITLRFPRFERLREDKDWTTATSLSDFVQLQRDAQTLHEEKEIKAHIRKKRVSTRKKQAIEVLDAEGPNVSVKSNLFAGRQMYILSESRELDLSKRDLERLARTNGATLVQHEGSAENDTKRKRDVDVMVFAERDLVKVAALKARHTHDIFLPSYLTRCIATNSILEPEPELMYFMTQATSERLKASVDEYGDSWINDVDVTTLNQIIDKMSVECDTTEVRDALLERMGDDLPPLWLFARYAAVFYPAGTSAEAIFRTAGGTVLPDLHDPSMTTVILDTSDRETIQEVRSTLSLRDGKQVRVVSTGWIEFSWAAKTILSESRFSVI